MGRCAPSSKVTGEAAASSSGAAVGGRRPHRRGVAAVDGFPRARLAVAALEGQAERDLAFELRTRRSSSARKGRVSTRRLTRPEASRRSRAARAPRPAARARVSRRPRRPAAPRLGFGAECIQLLGGVEQRSPDVGVGTAVPRLLQRPPPRAEAPEVANSAFCGERAGVSVMAGTTADTLSAATEAVQLNMGDKFQDMSSKYWTQTAHSNHFGP